VDGKDGVRLWLTKENGLMPTCVKPDACAACRTELVASQLRKSYVVLRAEYLRGCKAHAHVTIAALSAHTLTVVAQQVVPILTLGWTWMTPDEEEESVVYPLECLGTAGMFSSQGPCKCNFAWTKVCAECRRVGRLHVRFVSQSRFRRADKTPSAYAHSWWTGVTGAAEGKSEGVDGVSVSWLKCPLSVL
jgi:hypothetical protein